MMNACEIEPSENIRQKAEACRARQINAKNPVELRFAGVLNRLHIPFDYQIIFYRPNGYYVADFVLRYRHFIVEIDGSTGHKDQQRHDDERDEFFVGQGYRTIRIRSNDVFYRRYDVTQMMKWWLGLYTFDRCYA